MSLTEFYEADPAETLDLVRARGWAIDQAHRAALNVGWHIAALQRATRLPKLKDVLPPELDPGTLRPMRRRQFDTPDQEWKMWEAIAVSANANYQERVRLGLAPLPEDPANG